MRRVWQPAASWQALHLEQCDPAFARVLRKDLANLDGPIIQFVTDSFAPWQFVMEKSLCIDTTAAGGNAKLLIESGS